MVQLQPGQTYKDLYNLLVRQNRELWDLQFDHMQTPYWKRDNAAYYKKIEEMRASFHPIMNIAVPNFMEADIRILTVKSKMLQTQIATALEIARRQNGRYPQKLSDLVPICFKTLPIDPFSGNEFTYNLSPDAATYFLLGSGPTLAGTGGAVMYDPTNGTVSAGDLFYK